MNQRVFVNRILNLKKIKYIGLDMDHTLIRYNSKNFESLVYQCTVEHLISEKNYPIEIKQLEFNFEDAVRGLVVDSQHGNTLKLSRFGAIRKSQHGTKLMKFKEQKQFYRSIYVDLNDANYIPIDTSFSIAFCVLYGQLVDLKDRYALRLPSYEVIARDVLHSVDQVHANGQMKDYISHHLDEYVICDKALVQGLKRYIQYGKKIFILTNSEYSYTKLLLDYAINPYLESGETWQSLFEYIITLANKPRFFYDKLNFLRIDPNNGFMTNTQGKITPGVYQGGNAKQFTHDLGLQGDEILYIGDHIYGDILRLKKDCNWRTALVIEELGEEIKSQQKALPIEHRITAAMDIKNELEEQYRVLISKLTESRSPEHFVERENLQKKINAIDTTLSDLLTQQTQFYNAKWERVFRAGAEESFFAYQVERFACIYMEKLSDLFEVSPLTYFRARRRLLAHDSSSLHNGSSMEK